MVRLFTWVFIALIGVKGGFSLESPGPMTIYTEVDPPYNFIGSNGKPSGIFVEIVSTIQKRLGTDHPIQVVPWSRGYRAIQTNPRTMLFSMARTPEREKMFRWVGPVVENRWGLYGRRGAAAVLRNLEEARALRAIGSVQDFAWDQFLVSSGFTNLERVRENTLNFHKTMNGRLDAFVGADLTLPAVARNAGFEPGDFVMLIELKTIPLYLAFSLDFPDTEIQQWQMVLESLRSEGFISTTLRKFLGP